MNKPIIMIMPVMHGGGAERVAALLINEFHRQGCQCEFLLTNDTPESVIRNELSPEIPLFFLQDFPVVIGKWAKLGYALLHWDSTLFCRLYELFSLPVPAHFAYCSFVSQYHTQIQALHEFLKIRPEATIITFLQPSIPMVMLAARGLPNRVVFSERGDAARLMHHRYGNLFIQKYYSRADKAVFQTKEAQASYPPNIAAKGTIIPNPLKENLPLPYQGQRRKVINTFCRISRQKNLPLLLEAFKLLYEKYPDYSLHIIGDALNSEGEAVLSEVKCFVANNHLDSAVSFLPFSSNIHQEILADAMYVNSSDYEGMSNSMLEAMAIGLPTICTHCPVGGARAIIRNHENGLLVPVKDVQALANAMCEIVEHPDLAQKISENGAKIRDELNVEAIAKQWMELM